MDSYPVSFSHAGITVPDLEKAINFYTEAFGLYHVSGPTEVQEKGDSHLSAIGRKLYGKGWKTFRFAHCAGGDGVGYELFEFANNTEGDSINDPKQTNISHICVQHPQPADLLARIEAAGGPQTMAPTEMYLGEKPYIMAFAEDPFGNPIEIYSHSYELHTVGPEGPLS